MPAPTLSVQAKDWVLALCWCHAHAEGPRVDLPGIEPDDLPGTMPYDLQVHDISIRFVPSRYLRISIRVLTASRVRYVRYTEQSGETIQAVGAQLMAEYPSWTPRQGHLIGAATETFLPGYSTSR